MRDPAVIPGSINTATNHIQIQLPAQASSSVLLHSYPRNSIFNAAFDYVTGINRGLNAYHTGELLDMAL
ncbi:MAG: hypothetical protein WC547_11060, partial [Candidatus Omnitrophota bacterium]